LKIEGFEFSLILIGCLGVLKVNASISVLGLPNGLNCVQIGRIMRSIDVRNQFAQARVVVIQF